MTPPGPPDSVAFERLSRRHARTTRFYKVALILSVLVNLGLAAWIAYYPSFAEVSSIVDLAVGFFN